MMYTLYTFNPHKDCDYTYPNTKLVGNNYVRFDGVKIPVSKVGTGVPYYGVYLFLSSEERNKFGEEYLRKEAK